MCFPGEMPRRMGGKRNEQSLAEPLMFWWRRMDSNHRRRSQQIYSLSPLATWVLLHMKLQRKKVELVDGFEPPTC